VTVVEYTERFAVKYGRTVAVCSIDGVDLAAWLVRNGLALDWPTYSKGKYDKAQRDAEHAGRGLWAGSYVDPEDRPPAKSLSPSLQKGSVNVVIFGSPSSR
jgi:endonuclease YncB( thermonuclease family)